MKTPPVPTSRYGATTITYEDQLWLYAGTDGGFSKHGNGGYEQGMHAIPQRLYTNHLARLDCRL